MSYSPSDPRIAELRSLLAARPRTTIIAHHNPDGDAMGSALGLWHILRGQGIAATVVMPNTPAGNLQWMPGADQVVHGDRQRPEAEALLRECGLLFCLDFNRPDRVGDLEQALLAAPRRVLIDHHIDPADFTSPTFSDTRSPATCELVCDIAQALGLNAAIGAEAATCLYTGLVTDTGQFRFSSTTPHTLRTAALLMERGAVPDRIVPALLDDHTADRMRLLGFILTERMRVLPELETVVMYAEAADLKRFNHQPGDTEGFVNQGLSIRGIRISAFFMERHDGVKLSVRSKGSLPVNGLLRDHFDGGGHANAAGGRTKEPLHQAMERFIALLPELLAKHPAA
jgi:phosphoesterase RecJ-like protein